MNVTEPRDHAAALLAAIVESSNDAIVSKTLSGIITSWNAGAQRLFGYTAEEMLGASILLLIPPERVHEEEEILSRIRAGLRVEHYDTIRLRKGGTPVDVSITVSPIRDGHGTIVGASKIARDITAQKAAAAEREHLLESERAARSEAERLGHVKDEFLATLSHELRSPLNAILGWCQLLRESTFASSNQPRAVETIERNARAQAQIIDDLLDLSRIVSGKIRLEVVPMRLDQAVRLAVDVIQPAANAKRIQVTVNVESTPVIAGDTARMQQILWNLLSNAVKFTPNGGHIEINLRTVGEQAELTVGDSGIGISAQFLPHVFDRFRQAETGRARQYGGLGIGLSIVRNLVELHGGTIAVHSDGSNRGTLFNVVFNCLTEEQLKSDAAPAPPPPPQRRLDKRKILVLDDDPDGRDLLALLLTEHGAEVIQASSAQDAISALWNQSFDVVLSDIGMPGMDGYQFIQEVRGLSPAPVASVPAIALSAYARPEDRKRSLAAGFQMHIAKPYSVSGLLEAVQVVLSDVPPS